MQLLLIEQVHVEWLIDGNRRREMTSVWPGFECPAGHGQRGQSIQTHQMYSDWEGGQRGKAVILCPSGDFTSLETRCQTTRCDSGVGSAETSWLGHIRPWQWVLVLGSSCVPGVPWPPGSSFASGTPDLPLFLGLLSIWFVL